MKKPYPLMYAILASELVQALRDIMMLTELHNNTMEGAIRMEVEPHRFVNVELGIVNQARARLRDVAARLNERQVELHSQLLDYMQGNPAMMGELLAQHRGGVALSLSSGGGVEPPLPPGSES